MEKVEGKYMTATERESIAVGGGPMMVRREGEDTEREFWWGRESIQDWQKIQSSTRQIWLMLALMALFPAIILFFVFRYLVLHDPEAGRLMGWYGVLFGAGIGPVMLVICGSGAYYAAKERGWRVAAFKNRWKFDPRSYAPPNR